MQRAIPCTLMRGGTSRGLYLLADDLPTDVATRDRVLLALYGHLDDGCVSGVGGTNSVTNKVAIVSLADEEGVDLNYGFGQIDSVLGTVDTGPTCGNMLSGVGPFALESELIKAQTEVTPIRIRDLNTGALVSLRVKTPNGQVTYEGDTQLGGLVEAGAAIEVSFEQLVGNKTGSLLPTGNGQDTIAGINVTLLDVAMPMVHFRAEDLGVTGHETAAQLNAMPQLIERMEAIRLVASEMMGLGDARGKVMPKMAILSSPAQAGTICSRYFVPEKCHPAHAVSGGFSVASACMIPGSIAYEIAHASVNNNDLATDNLSIEHPSGMLSVNLDLAELVDGTLHINSASIVRTAKRIMQGYAYVSETIWPY